jgi:hypothetical protein
MADFIKAHGKPRLERYWIYKKSLISKNPLIFAYQSVCRICKQEKHLESCKFYQFPQIPITAHQIFD